MSRSSSFASCVNFAMFRLALWAVTTLFFAVSALEFTIPTSSLINGVTTGVPFNITWADAVGDVMLLLIDGTSNITVNLIQSDIADVSWYSWTPPTSLPNDSYRLEIGDITAAPAYSDLFPLYNGGLGITSQQVSISTSSTTFHHHTWSHTWTGSHTYTRSATATPSSTSQPPPPGCPAACSRNLNDTRVTHTPDTADVATTHPTSSSTSAESLSKPTQHMGLPNSTKAAISVGAALGGNIIIALAILTFWRGKRAARSRKGSADKFVMHGGLGAKVEPVEMDATAPSHTMDVDGRTHNVPQSENG